MIQGVYASTSGNTETVMETVAGVLREKGLEIQLQRAEKTPVDVIKNNTLFVFGTSTWEHGAINPFFKRLIKEMKEIDCAGKTAVFVGCGDQRYEPVLFCEGIEKVKKVWLSRGGQAVGDLLKIQGESYHQLDAVVKPWAERVVTWLSSV